jgi:elongation factor Ts
MAEITAEIVNKLRQKTNAGMMDCKKALKEAEGDLEKAETILRKKGITKAEGKADRATKEGIIASYIHMAGRVGVLIEVNCETDFVAKNENFQSLVKDLTLHIAAANPTYLSREEVPADLVEKEREIAAEQMKGKPANVVDKIVDGKMGKFYADFCLLEQGFIKNPDTTITDLIKAKITELGENIVVRRFTRYAVGGE